MTKKVDLRFTEIREAIIEISQAYKKCKLTNRAVAILICDGNRHLKISQVEAVLDELPRLEEKYLKDD